MLGADADIAATFVSPLAPDTAALTAVASSPEHEAATAELDELLGDRLMLLRVDRVDPSKNVLRGFAAFDLLLEDHPEWRGRVVFVARLNPTRESLAEYLGYRNEVEQGANRLNARWGTADWTPVALDTRDDLARTVAALCRYDVLLVNPLKDGLKLVAKEGPILNRNDGVLCLSPDAGAWDELGEAALLVHPYDLEQCAATLHVALSMAPEQRASRATRLRELASVRTPGEWLADQMAAAVG
jgi:trehalose 6-phosphate synthase